jgi:2-keto-3-deoxy-L-rhamnonate aldolase RhmA
MSTNCEVFRSRLIAGEPLIGTFIKTPSPIVAEVMGLSNLDVFCIDTEHAPFGRLELDLCIAAFRAADRPSLVRIADDSPREIRNALDSGATGIVVPHVTTAEQAARIVKAATFGEGGRGFAGSTRAANFTRKGMPDHIGDSAQQSTVIVQIEDLAALENVSEIAAVAGVDAIFIGRIDLAVAMGKLPMDQEVIDAVRHICNEATEVDATVGMFTPDESEIPDWKKRGVSLYLLSSDQSMMLAGADRLSQVLDQGSSD